LVKYFDFEQATLFYLGHRPSKHKTTRYVRNLGGGMVHLGPLAAHISKHMLFYCRSISVFVFFHVSVCSLLCVV